MWKGGLWMQIAATLSATLPFLITGTFIGWASPVLARMLNKEAELHITSDELSWIASFLPIGEILSPIPTGYLLDVIGRKKCLAASFIPFMLSWILAIIADSVEILYISRLVAGFGLGIVYTAGPIYTSEIAQDNIRGSLGTMYQVMLNIGMLFESCVGPYVSTELLGILSAIFPLLFIATFIWMPESPYYLVLRNRREDAEKSLCRLRCTNDAQYVQEELINIQNYVESSRFNKGGFKDLVFDCVNRRALIIVLGLIVLQNLCGINAIISYSTIIFKTSNTSLDPKISVIIITAVQVLLGMMSSVMMDIAGRRPMLLVSCLGCVVSLTIEGTFYYFDCCSQVDLKSLYWLPTTAMLLYLITYSMGLGPLPIAIMGEIFPAKIKGIASCVTIITLGVSVTVVIKLFQMATDEFGLHPVMWTFASCTLIGTFFVVLWVPETKGKTFLEINEELYIRSNGQHREYNRNSNVIS